MTTHAVIADRNAAQMIRALVFFRHAALFRVVEHIVLIKLDIPFMLINEIQEAFDERASKIICADDITVPPLHHRAII